MAGFGGSSRRLARTRWRRGEGVLGVQALRNCSPGRRRGMKASYQGLDLFGSDCRGCCGEADD